MSRLDDVIARVEKGEPVDLERVALLQALDLARLGEEFAAESLTRQREADDQLATVARVAP